MYQKSRRLVLIVTTFLVVALFPSSLAQAASTKTVTAGITVSPGQLSFTLNPQTTSQTLPLTITNTYNAAVTLTAQFKGIDEDANLLIPTDTVDPSFAPALSISETDIQLAARSTATVNVQVSNLTVLSPGGHYATLILTQQSLGGNPVSVKAAVSLGIFAVKTAGAVSALSLDGIAASHWLFHLPTTVSLGFVNTGNVLVVPRATVLVFTHDGKTPIKEGVVNEASLPLLPQTDMQASAHMITLAHTWLPQRVHLLIAYRADPLSQPMTAAISFWYVPPIYLLLILLPVFFVWRKVANWRKRGRPLPASITRVPPLGIMRRIRSTTRRIFIVERDSTSTIPVIVKAHPKIESVAETTELSERLSPKKTTRKKAKPRRTKKSKSADKS
jgi:hypothetical protein